MAIALGLTLSADELQAVIQDALLELHEGTMSEERRLVLCEIEEDEDEDDDTPAAIGGQEGGQSKTAATSHSAAHGANSGQGMTAATPGVGASTPNQQGVSSPDSADSAASLAQSTLSGAVPPANDGDATVDAAVLQQKPGVSAFSSSGRRKRKKDAANNFSLLEAMASVYKQLLRISHEEVRIGDNAED